MDTERVFLQLREELSRLRLLCSEQGRLLRGLRARKGPVLDIPVSLPIQCTEDAALGEGERPPGSPQRHPQAPAPSTPVPGGSAHPVEQTPAAHGHPPSPGNGRNPPNPGNGRNPPSPGNGWNPPSPGNGRNPPNPGNGWNLPSPGNGWTPPGNGRNPPGNGWTPPSPGSGRTAGAAGAFGSSRTQNVDVQPRMETWILPAPGEEGRALCSPQEFEAPNPVVGGSILSVLDLYGAPETLGREGVPREGALPVEAPVPVEIRGPGKPSWTPGWMLEEGTPGHGAVPPAGACAVCRRIFPSEAAGHTDHLSHILAHME